MEIDPANIERGLWVVLIIAAIWIIRRLRRRSQEADASYRSVSRGFAQRLAKKRPPHEVALEDVEEEEETRRHMTPEDWVRGRRQIILCFVALVLIVILSVVSCVRGGL
jgi:hypothetical protein